MTNTVERVEEQVEQSTQVEETHEQAKTALSETPEVKPNGLEGWRDVLSKGDEKRANIFSRYSSLDAVGDALIAANQRISSGELKPALPENPSDEELSQWRKANGIPEKPEDYDLNFDSGLVIGDEDKALVNQFLEQAHAKNMSPDHVKATVEWYYGLQEQQAQQQAEQDARDSEEAVNALVSDYGTEFPRNKNLVNAFLNRFPENVKGKLLNARDGEGKALFNDPDVFRAILSAELELNPLGVVVPGGEGDLLQGLNDRLEELQKWRTSSPNSREYKKYWEGGGREEYVELKAKLEAQKNRAS